MAAGGTPTNVKLGPGRLSYAPLGTTEPVSSSAALPSAWQAVGYTENGTEIATNITSEDIMVAEEFDAIDNVMTARTTSLTVEMAESTKKRLLLATGGGAAALDDSTPFELTDDIVGVMMVWDSDLAVTPTTANRRILFRSLKPSGNVTTVRRKAPAKSTISAVFSAIKPNATDKAVKYFPNGLGQI